MKQKLKVRSVIAQDLRTPKFRMRVVRSKKHYTRKGKPGRDFRSHENRGFILATNPN